MIPADLGQLDLQECATLPPHTVIAPLPIIREIRVTAGRTDLNLVIGLDDAVLLSTDLFEAYTQWDQDRPEPPAEWN